jgi:DNA-binding transcriptional LysR family regulator
MDFKTLLYFTTVADELNFTHAAQKLNMSQPPLSNQIKELEQDLGVRLFIRGKRHLQLTEAGRLFLKRARQIQSLADHAREELSTLDNDLSGSIRIGLVEGRAPFLVSRWFSGFREIYPRVRYSMKNSSTDELFDLLSAGNIDLAVIAAPYNSEEWNGIHIGKSPWTAVIPISHPLAGLSGQELPLIHLNKERLIVPARPSRQQAIERWFQSVGCEPDILCSLSNYTDLVALVEQNVGIGIFPQTTYTPNSRIVTKVITQPGKFAEYVLVWNKKQPLYGAVRIFLEYVTGFIEADLIHSDRFKTIEPEFPIPFGAELL